MIIPYSVHTHPRGNLKFSWRVMIRLSEIPVLFPGQVTVTTAVQVLSPLSVRVVRTVKGMSPAWAAPMPLAKTFFVEISGVDPLQGLGLQGLRINPSLVSSSLCKIPPARPKKSDFADRFHAGGCTEMRPKTPKEIRKREISTSIKVMPLLLVIDLHIGPS